MSKKTMICFTLSIGMQGERNDKMPLKDFGVTEKEWAAMPQTARNDMLNEWWREWSSNYIDGAAYIEDEE